MAMLVLCFSAVLALSPPSGPFHVGVREAVLIDTARAEVIGADAGKPRALRVVIWYPSSNRAEGNAYASPAVAAALAQKFSLKAGFENELRSGVVANARIARGTFRVVLLDHGMGMVPELYSGLASELASHGFIVAGINHTFTSMASELSDGVRVYTPPWPRNVAREVQGAQMGEYVQTWIADDRFVLDRLPQLASSFGWRRAIRTDGIIAIGHSYGGTTAVAIANADPRIAGSVDLDGSIYPGMPRPFTTSKPLLVMTTPNTRNVQDEFRGAEGATYDVTVDGSTHMTFTDAPMLETDPASTDAAGVRARDAIVRAEVVKFVVRTKYHRPG